MNHFFHRSGWHYGCKLTTSACSQERDAQTAERPAQTRSTRNRIACLNHRQLPPRVPAAHARTQMQSHRPCMARSLGSSRRRRAARQHRSDRLRARICGASSIRWRCAASCLPPCRTPSGTAPSPRASCTTTGTHSAPSRCSPRPPLNRSVGRARCTPTAPGVGACPRLRRGRRVLLAGTGLRSS